MCVTEGGLPMTSCTGEPSPQSIDQLTIGDMTRYQQSFDFGARTYELAQWIVSAFAQDSYRVRSDLTLDL